MKSKEEEGVNNNNPACSELIKRENVKEVKREKDDRGGTGE